MMWTGVWGISALVCVFSHFAATAAKWDDTVAPVTVIEPKGALNGETLYYHMAHFGAVPYGTLINGMRIVAIDPSCMCGDVPCNTGCGDFSLASAECQPDVNPGTQPGNGAMIMAEETGGDTDDGCLRSHRAHNVAKTGAQAVLIVAPKGTHGSALVQAPAVVSRSYYADLETLELQHVNIPVGLMSHGDAGKLKRLASTSNSGAVRARIDFRSIFEKQNNVTISIWHNTGDDCGPPCYYLHLFLQGMADIAKTLAPGHPIRIVPRFTYDTCHPEDVGGCETACINNGRYCHRKLENEHLWGRLIATENVRQACLYNVVRSSAGSDTRPFWDYKKYFQQNCQNQKRTFNHLCSDDAFAETKLSQIKYDAWKQCWANAVGDKDSDLPIVERDISGMKSQEIGDSLLATVVINDQHYRGALDAGHVMKAACAALSDDVRQGDAKVACDKFSKGHCAPGSKGDRQCGSAQFQAQNMGVCKETDDEDDGYRCECSAGYMMRTNNGKSECIDRNECVEFGTLCQRNERTRNACQNTVGSFDCKYDIADMCTAEKDWGGCWSSNVSGDIVTSCTDTFDQYSANLANGRDGGALFKCSCENIFGCWEGGDAAECTQKCDDPVSCNPQTQTCDLGKSEGRDGMLAGISGAAAVVLVLVALCTGIMLYRKRKAFMKEDQAPSAVVTDYANFRDGMDADEMQRSGVTDGKGAVAAVAASQYAMQAGGESNPAMTSLQLEEQSSVALES